MRLFQLKPLDAGDGIGYQGINRLMNDFSCRDHWISMPKGPSLQVQQFPIFLLPETMQSSRWAPHGQ